MGGEGIQTFSNESMKTKGDSGKQNEYKYTEGILSGEFKFALMSSLTACMSSAFIVKGTKTEESVEEPFFQTTM